MLVVSSANRNAALQRYQIQAELIKKHNISENFQEKLSAGSDEMRCSALGGHVLIMTVDIAASILIEN